MQMAAPEVMFSRNRMQASLWLATRLRLIGPGLGKYH